MNKVKEINPSPAKEIKTSSEREILEIILEQRGLQKLISTYYEGTLEMIEEDGCVHARFLHTKTGTFRTSCVGVNLQNQS